MDGMVDKIPSGSQVLADFHKCASVRIVRSNHAPRFVSFSRFGYPTPGTGTKFMSSQYTKSKAIMIRNWVLLVVFRKIVAETKNTTAIRCKTPGIRTVLNASIGSVKILG